MAHRPLFVCCFFALENILVLLAKQDSGELCCPVTALIVFLKLEQCVFFFFFYNRVMHSTK